MGRGELAALADEQVLAAGRRACDELAAALDRHGLMPDAPGATEARRDGDVSGLLLALAGAGLPALGYDEKCVVGREELAQVVEANIEATGGEWAAQELAAEMSVSEHPGRPGRWAREATVSFTYAAERRVWRFEQTSKYVASGFYEERDAFAAAALPGRFVFVVTGDMNHCDLYLPARASGEVLAVLGALPETYAWCGSWDYSAFNDRFRRIGRRRSSEGTASA